MALMTLSYDIPRSVLKNNSITVQIFERGALSVPVGVVRRHPLEACRRHAITVSFPLIAIGDVEDEEVILGRRSTDLVTAVVRELEMVAPARVTEHDAVEAVMVLEGSEDLEAESSTIHIGDRVEVVGRSGYTKMSVQLCCSWLFVSDGVDLRHLCRRAH